MIKHFIKTTILTILLGISFGVATPINTVFADSCDPSLPPAVLEANGCNSSSNQQLPNFIINIINVIIGILGLVAVLVIIYGGIQYMTSAGDGPKVKKAKETILYACIGLIVCVLAFAIVNFVIKGLNL